MLGWNTKTTKRERAILNTLKIGTPIVVVIIWQICGNLGWINASVLPAPCRLLRYLTAGLKAER
jgi:ABC-type nitrate/sulfonate/bicarbonate transport system permease component